jgi:ssDNA-binding Zn-finger/Zn-ribbon topoisomerase 1
MSETRLATDCPRCQSPLEVHRNRKTGELFLGCSGFPHCRFSEPYETGLSHLVNTFQVHLRVQDKLWRESLQRELRRLLILASPTRWPGNALAAEMARALLDLYQAIDQEKLP